MFVIDIIIYLVSMEIKNVQLRQCVQVFNFLYPAETALYSLSAVTFFDKCTCIKHSSLQKSCTILLQLYIYF